MEENKDIIFQVRIDRKDQDFELVKRELSSIEQLAFERYLQIYIDSMAEARKIDAIDSFLGEDEDLEE